MTSAKKATHCVAFSGNSYKYFSQHREYKMQCRPISENCLKEINDKNKRHLQRLQHFYHGRSQAQLATQCVAFSKFRLKTFRRFSPLSDNADRKKPTHFTPVLIAVTVQSESDSICYALRSVFKISHIYFSPLFRHPARRTLFI